MAEQNPPSNPPPSLQPSQPYLPGMALEPTLRELVDVLVKAGAVLVGLAYVLGFLVVTIHHAQLGINHLDLLKAKIVAAGAAFIVLTLIPAIFALRAVSGGFGIYGPAAPFANSTLERIQIGAWFYSASYLLALSFDALALFVVDRPSGGTWNYWSIACGVLVVLWLAISTYRRTFSRTHPPLFTLSLVVHAILFSVSIWFAHGIGVFIRTLWFWGVGIGIVELRRMFSKDPRSQFRRVVWELHLPGVILSLSFYATLIYSDLKPEFGGGAPFPVRLQIDRDIPLASHDKTFEAFLVDENDNGFYFARGDRKGTFFVTRDAVLGMEFLDRAASNKGPASGSGPTTGTDDTSGSTPSTP